MEITGIGTLLTQPLLFLLNKSTLFSDKDKVHTLKIFIFQDLVSLWMKNPSGNAPEEGVLPVYVQLPVLVWYQGGRAKILLY